MKSSLKARIGNRSVLNYVATLLLLLPINASAGVLIQELFYDAIGSDMGSVFTELMGDPGTNLDGWLLVGINGNLTVSPADRIYRSVDLSGGRIPADGIFVIAAVTMLQADLIANVDWQNGPDAVQLWDAGGKIVDAIQYGDAGRYNIGLGSPTADVAPGSSLSRIGNSRNNLSDFEILNTPTPGFSSFSVSVNPLQGIPEPSTTLMLLTGLILCSKRLRDRGNRAGQESQSGLYG